MQASGVKPELVLTACVGSGQSRANIPQHLPCFELFSRQVA